MPATPKPQSAKGKTPPVKGSDKLPANTPVAKKPKRKPALAKARKKKAAQPKPPVITQKQYEAWFLSQSKESFIKLANDWNNTNLEIKLPKLKGYDAWFNYFAGLSPAVIRRLAEIGLDTLPTDGYSALARWHDIINHPHRIDKVHQAGLSRPAATKGKKTISQLATGNDRLGVLMAIRDEIASKIQKGAGARDTASLAKEMTEIMTQIADLEKRAGPGKKTVVGELLGAVDLRRRPTQNGGGSRNTSFKSRITIKQIEKAEQV